MEEGTAGVVEMPAEQELGMEHEGVSELPPPRDETRVVEKWFLQANSAAGEDALKIFTVTTKDLNWDIARLIKQRQSLEKITSQFGKKFCG